MKEITYDYYRIFYYVAKYKSFSRAAEILHGNQPNITRCMNKLEEQLGCRLMLRSNKGIRLTSEGERLYTHVSVALKELVQAEDEIAGALNMSNGYIRIGATEKALHGILLRKLSEFHELYPHVRLKIDTFTTPFAVDAIRKGSVDFAVVTTPCDTPMDMRETKLFTFHEIAVVKTDAYTEISGSMRPEQVGEYPVIGLGRNSKSYEFYSSQFLPYGVEWNPEIDAASADMILPLVKAGLGIGFLPDFMAEEAIKNKTVRRVQIEGMTFERGFVLLEDPFRHPGKASEELIRLLTR